MDLTHTFTVPVPVEETWEHFNDIAAVGECFPGAVVTDVTDDSFSGTVKVKLGPIALTYAGSGTFTEKDEAAHRFKVEAKGKDKRGNGTAGANVTLSMSEADGGAATEVEVLTDLAITGKPAQFGRGVMQDVSDKLLGQFVACLEKRLSGPEPETDPESAPEPAAEPTPIADAAAASSGGAATSAASNGSSEAAASATPRPAPRPAPAEADDALDLGAAALPVLAKAYWKQALGAVLVLVVLRRLLRRD